MVTGARDGARALGRSFLRSGQSFSFIQTMADAELTTKVQPEECKKGGYSLIRSMPCRLTEVNHLPKATANGNKRVQLVGLHIFTGKKYEDTINCTAGFHGIDVPVTSKQYFALLDVDAASGDLSLLTDGGDTKEDVSLSRNEEDSSMFDAIGSEVVKRFEAGESLKVGVLSIMGKELVVEVGKG